MEPNIQTRYFAGQLGMGFAIAKVAFEYRPQIGPNGMFRIYRIERVYYGMASHTKLGTHITLEEFQKQTFDTFEEARAHLVGTYIQQRDDLTRQKEQITAIIAELFDLQP